MKNFITGKIISALVSSTGFRKWVEFHSAHELMDLTHEYHAYCKANDVIEDFAGFGDYLTAKIKG